MADGKSWRLKATPDENGGIIGWTADGKNILWSEANKTLNTIYVLSTDGKSITEWNKGSKDWIGGTTLNNGATHLGFILQNPSQMPEAYVSRIDNFSPVKITSINAENANKPLPKTELIKWKGADGREIEGLLTYPLNYKAGTKVPFILNVHGGPAGVFQQTCVAGNAGTIQLPHLQKWAMQFFDPIQEALLVMEQSSVQPTVPIGAAKILWT